jgi:hypothetical protein
MDTTASKPPATYSPPAQAMWWLKKGHLKTGPEWTMAHRICQQQEGTHAYDVVHALVHWIEGDQANAAYWYRRAGEKPEATISQEWHRVAKLTNAT